MEWRTDDVPRIVIDRLERRGYSVVCMTGVGQTCIWTLHRPFTEEEKNVVNDEAERRKKCINSDQSLPVKNISRKEESSAGSNWYWGFFTTYFQTNRRSKIPCRGTLVGTSKSYMRWFISDTRVIFLEKYLNESILYHRIHALRKECKHPWNKYSWLVAFSLLYVTYRLFSGWNTCYSNCSFTVCDLQT